MPGPLFIFMVLVGLTTVITAARFAFRPAERTLAIVRPLCAATTSSTLAAFFAGVTNGLAGLSRLLNAAPDPSASAHAWRTALGGFAESPVALIVGFALITVAWLLVAVGLRRQA